MKFIEPMFSHDLQRLIDQFVDGTISNAGLSQFDRALLHEPDAVEYFLDYCQMHIDLVIDLRADQSLESFRERQQRVAVPLITDPTIPQLPLNSGEVLFASPTAFAYFGFSQLVGLGIVASALLLLAVGGIWWWIEQRTVEN
ncbi:MAG: hypothetical protein IT427_08330, partial [Pirellulales bacterium]|nr:hypothetical protein [Pirellulales bacterium]